MSLSLTHCLFFFFFYCYGSHPDLHSFPTRRSSDLFYHGATNGSMKFDVFTAHLGFDHYFGRKEYNNEEHTDATWGVLEDRKSTRLNSSHVRISYAVFCLKKKKKKNK